MLLKYFNKFIYFEIYISYIYYIFYVYFYFFFSLKKKKNFNIKIVYSNTILI